MEIKKVNVICKCEKDLSMNYPNRHGCCPWCGLSKFEKDKGLTYPHKLDCPVFGVN